MGASSLAFLLASIGLTNVVASSLASEDASSPSKLSDRVATLCGAALLTLAACYGVKSHIRLTVVRTTVTAAVLLFTAIDYLLSIGQGLVRAARQHYRTFGASLAPGGAPLAIVDDGHQGRLGGRRHARGYRRPVGEELARPLLPRLGLRRPGRPLG